MIFYNDKRHHTCDLLDSSQKCDETEQFNHLDLHEITPINYQHLTTC